MKTLDIILLLTLSWVVMWFFENRSLSVLGLNPTKSRIKFSTILFIITAILCSTGFLMRSLFAKEIFSINPKANMSLVLTGLWLNFKSVLFEELLCRGVALYILIKKLGPKLAIIISATVFGALHLLNSDALSNPIQSLMSFTFTFLMGLLLAYSYAKTYSLYIPFFIHFGWNLVQNFIFPDGPFGNSLFITVSQPVVSITYLAYFTMLLFPKVSVILIDYLILKNYSRTEIIK